MYITFEGSNNTGKSTQLGRVKEVLQKFFEEYQKQIPQINIFHEGDTCKQSYDNWYEAVLDYARDRASTQYLIKGTEYSDITITDRSYYSSLVYQGNGDKAKTDYVRLVNTFAKDPDMVIFFKNGENPEKEFLYSDTIPYEKISFACTDDESIDETTWSIAGIIFMNWLIMYGEMDYDSAYELSYAIEDKIYNNIGRERN